MKDVWGNDVDPETNLPVVPEGYFWRVKKDMNPLSYFDLTVQLRRKWRLFPVETQPVRGSGSEAKVWGEIQQAAGYIIYEQRIRDTVLQGTKNRHKKFVGDFPPKRARSDATKY